MVITTPGKSHTILFRFPQKNIYDTEIFFSNSSLNNIGGYVFIEEKLDPKALEKAINLYVKNNDALRLKIQVIDGNPSQYLENYEPFSIEFISLKNMEEVEQLNQKIVETPFTIFNSDLFTFTIFQLPNGQGGFNVTLHHFISDAWGMSLLISGIIRLYTSIIHQETLEESSSPSYLDYISSAEAYFQSSRFQKDEEFWNSLFEEEPELSYICQKGKQELDTSSKRKTFHLSHELYTEITDFCKTLNISIYTFFMAVYSLYLSKINNVDKPIIGTPVLNRSGMKEKRTAGMFISTVPFKVNVDRNSSFAEFLKQVASTQLSIFKHQKYPYNKLLQNIKKKYHLSENLYDLVLSYQNARDDEQNSGVKHYSKWFQNGHILDSLEIHFYDMNNTGELDIYYDYQINKWIDTEIENIHARIMEMVSTILKNPDLLLKDIKVVTANEEITILKKFNDTQLDYDKSKTILQIFEEHVRNTPTNTALVFEEKHYTYLELDKLANQLANYLLSLKLSKNSVIGFMLNRSIYTVVGMLSCLKANMAYMLIEKDLPEDRIIYMLNTAKSPLLITSKEVNHVLFEAKTYLEDINFANLPDSSPNLQDKPDDCLSVVYTSGSTGMPKGVLIKRFSMVNLVNGYRHSIETDKLSNFLSICSVAFDMFAAEVWICLLSGKKLILANEEQSKEPLLLSKLIEKEKCEFMLITSSKMDLLLSNSSTCNCLKNLKAIQLGGEILNPKFYESLTSYTDSKIYNGYGPSETTSCCSCKYITSSHDINLGKPLPNINIYICNKDLNLCPVGITGELCISGDGVSYGYINNQEATTKSFVKNPFGKGLLYKSGDLAKWNEKGELQYIGRNDFQIKIRGLRVELEEINNAIQTLPEVNQSVTIVRKINHVDSICSFVVASSKNATTIKNKLAKLLPSYMIPSHIEFMECLPLTTNGKIDTKNLPEIVENTTYVSPKNETQELLAHIFEEFLEIPNVSIEANFFELGGDSLIAIKIITKLSADYKIDIRMKDIFDYPTIALLSEFIKESSSNKIPSNNTFEKAKIQTSYPASSAQKRIFYTMQTSPSSVVYNMPGGILFDSLPDVKQLEKALTTIWQRHEAFRTYFVIEEGEVKQKIKEDLTFSLAYKKDNYANLNVLFKEFLQPFDLSKAPLFRAQLVEFENKKAVLFVDFHHIVCDGSSSSIFMEELSKLYNGKTLSNISFDYKDYALWEENYFKSDLFKNDEAYWLSKFPKKEQPVLGMPTSVSRPSIVSFEGNKLSCELTNAKKLQEVCAKLNTTPYLFMLSVYYLLLYKYTNQEEIVVGTPVIGRNTKETNNMIGMFVNTLALKNKICTEQTFYDFVQTVTTNSLEAFEHQAYPFDQLVEKLKITKDTSRNNPLFDTMFVYQNEGTPTLSFDGLKTSYYMPDNQTSKFDFLLEVVPHADSLKLNLEYANKIYTHDFMEDFLRHFITLFDTVLENQNLVLKDISMLSTLEKKEVLSIYENNILDYPSNKSIITLFEEQVIKNPSTTAIWQEDEKLTYRELKQKVDYFSYYLYKRGVKKGDIVGTLLDRSSNLIVAMLAIMKCGAIYLPISKAFPEDRIDYILNNSKLKTLLVDSSYCNHNFKNDVIVMDSSMFVPHDASWKGVTTAPDDVIYSIYTSGSTGNPKGVLVTNQNLNNFVHCFKKLYHDQVGIKDTFLASTSICFDVSILEFFFCLLNGATLYLYPQDTIEDIFDFCHTLVEKKITCCYIPPNILNEVYTILAEDTKKVKLEKMLVGVEPIKLSTISKYYLLNPNMQIVNGYGPTETTICCTAFEMKPSLVNKYDIIPIGKPLSNLNAYVLDKDLNLLPKGIPGELYIEGDNVTKGYLYNSKLTNQKYIPSPFHTGKLMYTTGDVVKILPDGILKFIGRNDSQVKINGHRIELGEITNAISSYPSITKSSVLVKEQKGHKSLVAFFTADKKIAINDLRSFVSLKLPFYAVPSRFMQLDQFELTSNGKIDKKYLDSIKIFDDVIYEAPRNNFEKELVKLWQEFLNVPRIGITDNFFDLGGDSLIAIRLQIKAFKLGLNISYADIFSSPTIKQLSEKVTLSPTPTKNLGDYDYTKIDSLLAFNQLPITKRQKNKPLKSVLLTGSTGFVGVHILGELLANTQATIYCLVRNKDNVSYINRLYKTLHFYFDHTYDSLVGSRIKIIQGDITDKHLGFSEEDYTKIGSKLSCVINSAAIVKHYGKSSDFDRINIEGVQNIVDFCKNFDIKLYHLSTLSVSGNVFAEGNFSESSITEKTTFRESQLYIGQDISNLYVYTKFMAERLILENVANHALKATIIRLGNITNRYSDGKFQINISENAFLSRILAFVKLGCIPDYLLEGYGEFTPVDYVANAIVKIAECPDSIYTVLHLYNTNHLPMKRFIELLNEYGLKMDILPEKDFLKVVDSVLNTDESILSGIINDFDKNKKLVYDSNIILKSDFTNEFLNTLSFSWCKIGKIYLFRYLDYLKNLGDLGGN